MAVDAVVLAEDALPGDAERDDALGHVVADRHHAGGAAEGPDDLRAEEGPGGELVDVAADDDLHQRHPGGEGEVGRADAVGVSVAADHHVEREREAELEEVGGEGEEGRVPVQRGDAGDGPERGERGVEAEARLVLAEEQIARAPGPRPPGDRAHDPHLAGAAEGVEDVVVVGPARGRVAGGVVVGEEEDLHAEAPGAGAAARPAGAFATTRGRDPGTAASWSRRRSRRGRARAPPPPAGRAGPDRGRACRSRPRARPDRRPG